MIKRWILFKYIVVNPVVLYPRLEVKIIATTRLLSIHQTKGKSAADCISDSLDYIMDFSKTENGKYITCYACDPETVKAEFILSKRIYEDITGRKQGKNIVLFQIRQSFKPGEVTAEQAHKIAYELAMSFTKGKHAFVVATHTDKAHIHTHIDFNSTSLDCTKKFRDFKRSGKAIMEISDRLCLENGLSIIETPKRSTGNYGKWLGDKKTLSHSDKLRQTIDEVLAKKPKTFDEFLLLMKDAGYEIKSGKHYAFKSSVQKKFIRLRSLGSAYSEDEIILIIKGKAEHKTVDNTKAKKPKRKEKRVNMLVDIQQKLDEGKGKGYEQWAKIFNIKQMAKTINYLRENNLIQYEELEEKATEITEKFNRLNDEIKTTEKRLAEIIVLEKHIYNYAKTRDIYIAYRKAGYSKKFFEEHRADITLHKAAKTAFNELGVKKLPTTKSLEAEYAELLSQKKKDYILYQTARKEMQEIVTAKANVDKILDVEHDQKYKEKSQNQR